MNKIYNRKLNEGVRKWVGKKTIVVVTGMRQVGKTTLCRMLFEKIKSGNKVFIDLENPLNRRIFEELDYDNIWSSLEQRGLEKGGMAYVFLDEVQLAPGVVRAVKYLFDHYNIQFFLTGSSSFYLKNLFPESLAGRKVIFELFPLDFEEFLWFKGFDVKLPASLPQKDKQKNIVSHERRVKLYEEYLAYGGFPKVVLERDRNAKGAIIEDIYTSYFEKDVRSLADFSDMERLQELILLLMKRTGSKLNIARIASELGMSRNTVYSYISFLEATYFISLLPPFSRSPDREVSGAKKVYFCDTGMLNRTAQVSSGALLENAVFNSLRKEGEVSYYQKRTGPEIDFILDKGKAAVEAKETATSHDFAQIRKISESIRIKECYVVSKNFVGEKGFIPVTEL